MAQMNLASIHRCWSFGVKHTANEPFCSATFQYSHLCHFQMRHRIKLNRYTEPIRAEYSTAATFTIYIHYSHIQLFALGNILAI